MSVLGATSLTGCNSIPDFIAGGSLMLFQQTTAPTSWTKQTTHNNKALRVVSGTAGSGGSTAFTSVFSSRIPSGSIDQITVSASVQNTTLQLAQIPSHAHAAGTALFAQVIAAPAGFPGTNIRLADAGGPGTSGAGSNGAHAHPISVSQHNHTFTGTSQDFAVQYVDIIIASKN